MDINGNVWPRFLKTSWENGTPSNLIQISQLDWPEAQMFCVSFNNLTVLIELMESTISPWRQYHHSMAGVEKIVYFLGPRRTLKILCK